MTAWSLPALFVALGLLPLPAHPGDDEPEIVKSFRALCAAKAAEAETVAGEVEKKTGRYPMAPVFGKEGWLFLPGELRHIAAGPFWGEHAEKASRAATPENRDPLRAIADYAGRLKEQGIRLIFMPVPPKAFVYPEMLMDGVPQDPQTGLPVRLDTAHQKFYALLREQGVEVIDLLPFLLKLRRPGADQVYCRQDTHYSAQTCVEIARMLAEQIKKEPWYKDVPRLAPAAEAGDIQVRGDLARDLEQLGVTPPPLEKLRMRSVGKKTGAGLTPLEDDRRSPVLLFGDSHVLVFHIGEDLLARGAGLADQLACELGFAVDLVGSRGSGTTTPRADIYRRGKADTGYLKTKKVFIWCLAARYLTESTDGWSAKIPVVPVPK
jgi:hypothetical protein